MRIKSVKEFLKPSVGKIVLFIILFFITLFIPATSTNVYIGLIILINPIIYFITAEGFSNAHLSFSESFFYIVLGIVSTFILYTISCFIVRLYDKYGVSISIKLKGRKK